MHAAQVLPVVHREGEHLHTVTGPVTYGYRLRHIRLQAQLLPVVHREGESTCVGAPHDSWLITYTSPVTVGNGACDRRHWSLRP